MPRCRRLNKECRPLVSRRKHQLGKPLVQSPVTQGSIATASTTQVWSDPAISPEDANQLLIIFRTEKLVYLPLISISPDISSEELRQQRPFLWLCIMAVTSISLSQQATLASTVREILAQKMVVEFERNIELLLGLLVCIGW